MNNRWAAFLAACLVVFASLAITWQMRHRHQGMAEPYSEPYSSLGLTFKRGSYLSGVSNIVDRSGEYYIASGTGRTLDLLLPVDVRIFLTDMTGPTNAHKLPIYYYLTYHLFPRAIDTSLDGVTHLSMAGFTGRTSESDQEIRTNGFDVRLDYLPGLQLQKKMLRNVTLRPVENPAWFNTRRDTIMAFLLPLLTALAGMWLLRWLFATMVAQMAWGEQLACALGLGMMTLAALTLGIKLMGFHGHGVGFGLAATGALAELWYHRKALFSALTGQADELFRRPLAAALILSGLLVFAILFRIAGLEGMVDPDAAMAWLLKAKILHLCAGNDLIHRFADPHLALANLDYPILMPALHAATYDAIGHVDEFVTKFWSVWMLLFLFAALASQIRGWASWRIILLYTLFGLLLLPAVQRYGQMEGGATPMIFFTGLGFVQCARWLLEKHSERLRLGLLLLLGAALTKFEGAILLGLAGSWMLLVPSARPSLKWSPAAGRLAFFGIFAALPFLYLRGQIPAGYQSGWLGSALHHPASMLANWPAFFLIQFAPLFVSRDLASWSGAGETLHWTGNWHGFASLFNQPTLGLGWLCVLLTIALWFAVPGRRPIILWIMAMLFGSLSALSVVFASFVSTGSLAATVSLYAEDLAAGRYLLPVLLGWFAVLLVLIFAEWPATVAGLAVKNTRDSIPVSVNLPELKTGGWLLVSALLVLVAGGIVLPKVSPLPPVDLRQNTNPRENVDMQLLMGDAIQLEKDGKYAEAIAKFREAVGLYPHNAIALNNLAWSLVTVPIKELRNGHEAVLWAGQGVELSGGMEPDFIRTLAAAYAEDGQYDRADETARKAYDVALANHQPELAAKNDQLLKHWLINKTGGSTNAP